MIDVIIPAYNSQETIIKTLSSIAMQLNKDELVVTIVNDGGKDYKKIVETFKPILNVREIGYETNRGPGHARQFGVDNTKEEFITFIDADDTFYEACSLTLLSKPLKDTSAKFVISPFIQIGKNCEQAPVPPCLVWVFGHIFRRSFLNEHNIRMTSTRANEDVGYNTMCNLIAQHEMGPEGGKILTVPTYEWHYNEVSITRRGKSEYEYGICTPGYIYNLHHAYDIAQREGVTMKELATAALETAFSCYTYYNVALNHDELPKETLEGIEELSRKFFYDYYNQIQQYISKDEYNQIYTQAYNGKMVHLQGIIPKITLQEFIDLMFSKEPNETTYAQLEEQIQNVAEQL